MAGYKIGRVTQDIQCELSSILRELKDPRISQMLSIVKVHVSNDMSHCKVYVSAIEGMDKTKESVQERDWIHQARAVQSPAFAQMPRNGVCCG